MNADFVSIGATRFPSLVATADRERLCALANTMPANRPGMRVAADVKLAGMLQAEGAIGKLAAEMLGPTAKPVRAVMFNETAEANWIVPWHQDRTIAVRARHDMQGFGPWSVKAGLQHVEPPFDLLAGMVTVRIHLDDCDAGNAPLLIAQGSHRLGRVRAAEAANHAARIGHTPCLADAGDVWLYATPILHASERASRPRQRRVLQVDYAAADLPGELDWLGLN